MYRKILSAALILVLSLIFVAGFSSISSAATLQVDPTNCDDATGSPAYCTIQAAINAASAGDVILVQPGTYPEVLTINKSLSIIGAGSNKVTIDATAATGYHLTVSGVDKVTLQGFTLLGSSSGSYGIKVSSGDAAAKRNDFTLQDVIVKETGSTGVDILGIDGVSLSNVTVMDTGGAGITLTDVDNATLSDITTSGNNWAVGIGINTYGRFSPGGSQNITLAHGSIHLSELLPVKTEVGNYNDPANPIPLVNFDPGDYRYAIGNDRADLDPNSRVYMDNEAAAINSASLVDGSYVMYYNSNVGVPNEDRYFIVGVGVQPMSIQAAINAANPGERIEIRAGTYPEYLTMNKSLTIVGAGSDQVTIDASSTTSYHFSIYDASDVTLEGFTLMGAGADSGSSYGLKVSGIDATTKAQNLSVTDVVVKDTGSTGVDINGVDGVTLTGITVTDTGGAGITLTDVDRAMLSQVSTSGNNWGVGLNISTYGKFYPGGSDGITIEAGTVQFSELLPIKTEIDNEADPANPYPPYPIVNFDPGDYRYAIHNDTLDPNSAVYMSDMMAAVNSASLVPGSYIIHYVSGLVNPTSGSEDRYFLVGDGAIGVMSIQVAIDAANPG